MYLVLLICLAGVADCIWQMYDIAADFDTPESIHDDSDWNKHVKRDFSFYDLDWNNHSNINKCHRILDTPVDMNTSNRALLTCPSQLSVDISCIPNAGLGVWTRTHIPRLTVFGPFEGERVVNDSADHSNGWNLNVMNWRANESIVADNPATSNWMRYVNSARSYAELNIKKYVDYMGNVYYIALEDIAPYTELLVNYPHSFNIMPSLFWSGQARHNLTYVMFDCKHCNMSSYSPIFTKQHIETEHKKGHSQGKLEDFLHFRNPPEGLFDIISHNNLTEANLKDLLQSVPRRIKRSVIGGDSETKKFTTSKTKTPILKTTEEIKHINLNFDSPHNLEEKIKKRLRDAGVPLDSNNANPNMSTTVNGQTHPVYNDEFMEYAQKSDSGGMGSNQFNDFMTKLKVLKTYGQLNVSKEREDHAVKYFTPGTDDPDISALCTEDTLNNTEHILRDMKNLLNETISSNQTSSLDRTTFVTTTKKIRTTKFKRTRATTILCTCPTYSDYRFMWHNISIASTEEEFKLNETNNLIEVRHRWYNESSEPQYGDVSTSEDMNNTRQTTVEKIRTSKTTTIKRTRKKRMTTVSNRNETCGLPEKTPIKRTRKKTTEITTKSRRRSKFKIDNPTTKSNSKLKQGTKKSC